MEGHPIQPGGRAVQKCFPKEVLPVPSSGEWVDIFLEKGLRVEAIYSRRCYIYDSQEVRQDWNTQRNVTHSAGGTRGLERASDDER